MPATKKRSMGHDNRVTITVGCSIGVLTCRMGVGDGPRFAWSGGSEILEGFFFHQMEDSERKGSEHIRSKAPRSDFHFKMKRAQKRMDWWLFQLFGQLRAVQNPYSFQNLFILLAHNSRSEINILLFSSCFLPTSVSRKYSLLMEKNLQAFMYNVSPSCCVTAWTE